MTVEELLKQRYKIIADFPYNTFGSVGDILDRDWGWNGNDEKGFERHISDYPHLFKPLQWWEDRKLSELPKYVKCIKTPNRTIMPGTVFKVEWADERWAASGNDIILPYTKCYEPATKEEYEAYLKTH